VIYEIKQQNATHQSSATTDEAPGDWGSYCVEHQWGQRMRNNHEEDLRLWNDVPQNVGQTKDDKQMNPVHTQTKKMKTSQTERTKSIKKTHSTINQN
jgi:hypothetical protein